MTDGSKLGTVILKPVVARPHFAWDIPMHNVCIYCILLISKRAKDHKTASTFFLQLIATHMYLHLHLHGGMDTCSLISCLFCAFSFPLLYFSSFSSSFFSPFYILVFFFSFFFSFNPSHKFSSADIRSSLADVGITDSATVLFVIGSDGHVIYIYI